MAGSMANTAVSDSGGEHSEGFMAFLAEKKEKLDSFQKDLASAIMPSLPGQPAGKYQDIAIGIDMHPTMFPPSPIMAVPHVGMVFDIMGALFAAINSVIPPTPEPPVPEDGSDPEPQPLSVSTVAVAIVKAMTPSVLVNNKFIANAGISIQHLPGIVLHALPSVSPMASSEMFMGSATVLADGSPFSAQFLPALSCNLVGIPAPFRPSKPKTKMSLMAPTSALLSVIPGGLPVLVGGPPTIDLMALAMSLGLKGLGKLARKTGGAVMKKTKGAWQKIGNKLQKKIDNMAPKNPAAAARLQKKKCRWFGEPVDAATGRVVAENVDFTLPGPIPLVWTRYYHSDAEILSPLGSNWHHSYHCGYWETSGNTSCILFPDGRQATLPKLVSGDMYYNRTEKITWFKDKKGVGYRGEDGLTYRFASLCNEDGFYPLESIQNDLGFKISLEYRHGSLSRIIDSAGRKIKIENENGRITCIHTTNERERVNLIRYEVDKEDNLIKITEASGVSKHFYYEGHLLVKLTNQTGLSFYWEYEGKGDQAKCVHTWGDNGILEYWTRYEKGKTIVTNSLGNVTTYYYNADKLIYRITDANGGETYQDYNDFQDLEMVTDPIGNTTKYSYDLFGNMISIEDADKNKTLLEYDSMQRLISYVSPGDSAMYWKYDSEGKLIHRTFADGRITKYEYEGNQLISLEDDARNRTTFSWNEHHELVRAVLDDGRTILWTYDDLGSLLKNIQPNGATTAFKYDAMGNVVSLIEPDGNKHTFEYDAAGNVIRAKDALRDVSFTYWGLGNLKSRTENGETIEFQYNTEEELITITNEKKEAYRFTLDPLGQIVGEWGFDGLRRRYVRDRGGRVTKVLRPQERWTKYMYSGTGNILVAEHYDGTGEYFNYDGDGRLIEATNEFSTVKLSYEKGRVVSEDQNGHVVESTYNRLGQRIHIGSSLGADIQQEFAKDGTLTKTASKGWEAQYQRDQLGLEIQRMVSGDITVRTERDRTGRVICHKVQNKNIEGRCVRYQWGRGDRLLSSINDLTHKKIRYTYDEVGNLQAASYKNGLDTIYKMPDAVGNIFKTKSRNDREYGKGGKLLKDDTASYSYDEEGNLIEKFVSKAKNQKDIGAWKYEWFGNGMLKSVLRPGTKKINFEYDALGRRTAKIIHRSKSFSPSEREMSARGSITRFIWDGNVPLHEWSYDLEQRPKLFVNANGDIETDGEEPVPIATPKVTPTTPSSSLSTSSRQASVERSLLTTWIFENNSFVPQAKIVGDQKYSIVCDYLGTPVQAYSTKGEKVWDCELDIYGNVLTIEGNKTFIPFRYQGQYEDVETGLYYNRFRYYSADSGLYLSQDPIKVLGNNPNFYGYTQDNNTLVDIFGLAIIPTVTKGTNGAVKTANATVTTADLGTGTNTNASSRAYARSLGNVDDDAGHMIGKQLGGSGGKKNVFPQDFHVNRGQFAQFEGEVVDLVKTHGKADIKLDFDYGNGGTRPTRVKYTATAPDGSRITRRFNNSH